MENAEDDLKNAVVIQAARDYKFALLHNNKYTIKECEEFFTSDCFNIFSTLDGATLMQRIRQEALYDR